jgi:hypothetical protein
MLRYSSASIGRLGVGEFEVYEALGESFLSRVFLPLIRRMWVSRDLPCVSERPHRERPGRALFFSVVEVVERIVAIAVSSAASAIA